MLSNKRLGRIMALTLALLMVLSAAPVYAGEAQGPVTISKTAVDVDSSPRYYDITLSVTGNTLPQKPVDVVLVIDRSLSMQGDPMSKTKTAAKNFVTSVLDGIPGSRVAVVSYAGNELVYYDWKKNNPPKPEWSAKQETGFSSDKTAINNAINGITLNEGTNIMSGFQVAEKLIKTSPLPKDQRAIVLMSDGAANFGNWLYIWPNWYAHETPLVPLIDYPIYDTLHVQKAKDAGKSAQNYAKVFTVGLFNALPDYCKPIARGTLQDAATPGCYYDAASPANMDDIYQQIATELGKPATGALVEDVIPVEFEYVPSTITCSKGSTQVLPDNPAAGETKILWTIGEISTGETATCTYRVKAKGGQSSPSDTEEGKLYTNKYATLSFTNPTGQTASATFEKPKVYVPAEVVNTPGLMLTKYGPQAAKAGEEIIYYFTVTNTSTGNITLYNIQVTDPLFITADNPTGLIETIDSLSSTAGSNNYYFSEPYTIPADYTGTELVNTATATVVPEQESPQEVN